MLGNQITEQFPFIFEVNQKAYTHLFYLFQREKKNMLDMLDGFHSDEKTELLNKETWATKLSNRVTCI